MVNATEQITVHPESAEKLRKIAKIEDRGIAKQFKVIIDEYEKTHSNS
jgi:hypothetical protein